MTTTAHSGYSATSMVFSPSGGVLFTGGSDMRIRGWNLAEAKKSRMVVNSASSQAEGHRYDVTYSERKLEGIELIEENRDNIVQVALEESDWGLIGPPPGHWDVISSLQYISKVQITLDQELTMYKRVKRAINFSHQLPAMAVSNCGNKNKTHSHSKTVHKKFYVVFTSFSDKDKLLINYSTFKIKLEKIFPSESFSSSKFSIYKRKNGRQCAQIALVLPSNTKRLTKIPNKTRFL